MVSFTSLLVLVVAVFPVRVQCLWPQPTSITSGTTALNLSPRFYIQPDVYPPPADLLAAITQTELYLRTDSMQRLVLGRGAYDMSAVQSAKTLSSLVLSLEPGATVESISTEAVKALGTRSEGYTLTVPADGSTATLKANSTLGLYRGLTTFSQMWYEYNGQIYTVSAPYDIVDSPAYPFRGFMLDTARNYFPVSDIYRTLDAMSWVKINTFHWHITDSQSFPLIVSQYPELAQYGAYSSADVYTPTDIQNIVSYAAARGIDVLLEIDTPGHTASIADSHPEYVACNQATPWSTFANEPPAGQLRFTDPAVRNFTASLLSSIAKTLPSTVFSTGGDELNINCYTYDNQTQAELNSTGLTLEESLSVFTQATHGALIAEGKTPVVWEEMVLDHNVTLSNDTIVMVWISSADAALVADKGFRFVQAPSDYFYLDCGGGGWVGDYPAGNSWCDPFKTWQRAYTYDPLANLTTTQIPLVLGGEQLLWTEQSSPTNLDPIVWPRAAASAEVFWTATTLGGGALNVTEALPRLHDIRYRMVQRGVNAIVLQPLWCALRPDACDLNA
ncbi:glycoside hydrolase family 20 protein [Neolentinus lepideus HHB14362 ss-1]|uniref:Beta-hexosaminidase n=1 Tax=Neolentinus lepideus HHB14362 ss-1 TaxID=1314782 RepID=A0A165UUS1_9AGAM|nr:glycoside hydrolase family 20 protein [Neolentinus lepideus HHB14362 ss-1]